MKLELSLKTIGKAKSTHPSGDECVPSLYHIQSLAAEGTCVFFLLPFFCHSREFLASPTSGLAAGIQN